MVHKYLIAVGLARGLTAPALRAVRQDGDRGMAAAQIIPRAVAIWRPLAEKGDADAAFNLGQAYRLGRGVTINLGAAQTWFERAASKGHLDAQTTLGLMLFENGDRTGGLRGSGARPTKASPARCSSTAPPCSTATAVKQDPLLGYAYVSRAAAQGLAPAQGDARATRPDSAGRASARKRVAIAHGQGQSHAPTEVEACTTPKRSRRRPLPPAARTSSYRAPRRQAGTVAGDRPGGSSSARSRSAAPPKPCSASCRPALGRAPAFYVPAGPSPACRSGPSKPALRPQRRAARCKARPASPCRQVA